MFHKIIASGGNAHAFSGMVCFFENPHSGRVMVDLSYMILIPATTLHKSILCLRPPPSGREPLMFKIDQ
jgi:hypothetical protein